jgi:hypothetical protein
MFEPVFDLEIGDKTQRMIDDLNNKYFKKRFGT